MSHPFLYSIRLIWLFLAAMAINSASGVDCGNLKKYVYNTEDSSGDSFAGPGKIWKRNCSESWEEVSQLWSNYCKRHAEYPAVLAYISKIINEIVCDELKTKIDKIKTNIDKKESWKSFRELWIDNCEVHAEYAEVLREFQKITCDKFKDSIDTFKDTIDTKESWKDTKESWKRIYLEWKYQYNYWTDVCIDIDIYKPVKDRLDEMGCEIFTFVYQENENKETRRGDWLTRKEVYISWYDKLTFWKDHCSHHDNYQDVKDKMSAKIEGLLDDHRRPAGLSVNDLLAAGLSVKDLRAAVLSVNDLLQADQIQATLRAKIEGLPVNGSPCRKVDGDPPSRVDGDPPSSVLGKRIAAELLETYRPPADGKNP